MQDIKIWEEKIKEKRKKTEFRDFLKEIASWRPLTFYSEKGITSIYPKTDRKFNIVHHKEFEEKRQSPISLDYNFSKTFFENFGDLLKKSYLPNVVYYGVNENAEYGDQISKSKNIYLSYVILGGSENILYSLYVKGASKNVLGSVWVCKNSENIYQSGGILSSYKIFYSRNVIGSNNIWFSYNLNGCIECIFCNNLKNKFYCINNKEYSKEEYFVEKEKILKNKSNFQHYYESMVKVGISPMSAFNENVENTFYVENVKNGKNLFFAGGSEAHENMYDCFAVGTKSDFYGCISAGGDSQKLFCGLGMNGYNLYYSYFLEACSFCIGCIGLKNKSFCILNKQYSKEEWYELTDKIFSQMDKDGILGDFFYGSLNPFYFNDTMAYLIDDSFTKEEVEKEAYMWRDGEIKVDIPDNCEIVSINPGVNQKTPGLSEFQGYDQNGNWRINTEIMKKVIKDEKGNIYKIVPIEYEFLMKHSLPLPEIHWLDRIKLGFKFK